jgi:hypothetical protein
MPVIETEAEQARIPAVTSLLTSCTRKAIEDDVIEVFAEIKKD